MKVLHPFMPFITEEIREQLKGEGSESIMISLLPKKHKADQNILNQFEFAKEVIIATRSVRSSKNIPNKEQLDLLIKKNNAAADTTFDSLVAKLCNLSKVDYVEDKVDGASSFMVKSTEFYVPLAESVDVEAEIAKLEEELKYTQGFMNSVMKKFI